MLKQLKNNEDGVIFITVLAIILMMAVLTISILSMNVTQVISTERAIQDTQSEILAMGALSYAFANQMSDSPSSFISYTEILGKKKFTITANVSGTGLPGYNTQDLVVDVTY